MSSLDRLHQAYLEWAAESDAKQDPSFFDICEALEELFYTADSLLPEHRTEGAR